MQKRVIVLGSLKGNIFAGVDGNENAFVVALEMSPMQIKIGRNNCQKLRCRNQDNKRQK